MTRRLDLVFLALFVVLLRGTSAFAEHDRSVVIAYDDPALEVVARRVLAEVSNAGRKVALVQRHTPLESCATGSAAKNGSDQVDVYIRWEGDGRVMAEICAYPEPNQMTLVTARGRADQKSEFAIVVTEALHGLLLAPSGPSDAAGEVDAVSENENDVRRPENRAIEHVSSSLSVQPLAMFDVATGNLWGGVVPRFQLPLSRRFGFGAEVFVGFHPMAYSDARIDLESHLMWARLPLQGSGSLGPVLLSWQVAIGLYSVRATATAAPPREEGSDGSFGAILHAGGAVEFPAKSRFFLRGTLGASSLVPRLRYQLSQDVTPVVGDLLLEGGLGLGMRFDLPR